MTAGPPLRVAVVDTDSGFLQVLGNRIERLGWEHRVVDAAAPLDTLAALRPAAVVVDPALFGDRAMEVLAAICDAVPGAGVLVCTQEAAVAERVRGLRLGADDWIAKPCHPEEVVARVEAVVRRTRGAVAGAEPVRAGELEIRPARFQAFVAGRSLELTRREFELVALLAAAGGRVLTREEIYERVWGYAMARGDRSVDVFVRKVRQKLSAASPAWRYVHTQFGVGFRFAAEPHEEAAAAVVAADPAREVVPVA
jgi:DNA-binding response OmpR family regulator